MGKWKKILLNEATQLQKGQQVNRSSLDTTGDYYVLNGGTQPSGYLPIFNTKENTISISEGGNSCGYVQYNIEKFWSGGHNYTLKNINPLLQDKYLYYYLKYREPIIMSMRVGSGLPNIQKKDINKFPILFPQNIKEQEKIAEILGEVDKAIDSTNKLIDKYNLIKEGMLQDLLTNGIDENGKIRSEATHKYKDSPLGRIPVEWEIEKLRTFSEINMGQSPNGDTINDKAEGMPFLQGNADFSDLYPKAIYWCNNPIKKTNIGDLLVSVRAPVGAINISNKIYCIGRGLCAIKFKCDKDFGRFLFTNNLYQLIIKSQGSTFLAVSKADIQNILTAKPISITEQKLIAEKLMSIEKVITVGKEHFKKLQVQKQALMQDLLTNKVSVDCLL